VSNKQKNSKQDNQKIVLNRNQIKNNDTRQNKQKPYKHELYQLYSTVNCPCY